MASPLAFVVAESVPRNTGPGVCSATVTTTPAIARSTVPPGVLSCTVGCTANGKVFTTLALGCCATTRIGGPTGAVAVTGITAVSEPMLAVSDCPPTVAPRIQLPTVATPDAFVVAGLPVTLPPLEAVNVTWKPMSALSYWSVTCTAGAVGTALPAGADCPLPAATSRLVGGPVTAVRLNCTTAPDTPASRAVTVMDPGIVE